MDSSDALTRRHGTWRRRLRRAGPVLLGVLALGVVSNVGIRRHILSSTAAHRYTVNDAPSRPIAIVLGARIWDGRPSPVLEKRLRVVLRLYESGRCEKILVSGARYRDDFDEVTVMQQWLEARGVAPEDLFLDRAGVRTLDSMVRAKEVFGAERVIVVSQDFHLPRAVYIGRSVELDTIGVSAPPGYYYPLRRHLRDAAREHLAQVRAWLDLHVLATQPRFGGDRIDLASSGTATL